MQVSVGCISSLGKLKMVGKAQGLSGPETDGICGCPEKLAQLNRVGALIEACTMRHHCLSQKAFGLLKLERYDELR